MIQSPETLRLQTKTIARLLVGNKVLVDDLGHTSSEGLAVSNEKDGPHRALAHAAQQLIRGEAKEPYLIFS